MISYAQNFEDVYIRRAFQDVDFGFYVDVGAYDPVEDSVTEYFYRNGWSGVNIEPGPTFDRFPHARPRDINLNVAISSNDGMATFFYHEDDPGTSGLNITLGDNLSNRITIRRPISVTTKRLNTVFSELSLKHIHFLKLDIEGFEEEVVLDTDWNIWRPELIIIESTLPYSNVKRVTRCNEHLLHYGYTEIFFDGINSYFLRAESLERKGAFFPVNVLDQVIKHRDVNLKPNIDLEHSNKSLQKRLIREQNSTLLMGGQLQENREIKKMKKSDLITLMYQMEAYIKSLETDRSFEIFMEMQGKLRNEWTQTVKRHEEETGYLRSLNCAAQESLKLSIKQSEVLLLEKNKIEAAVVETNNLNKELNDAIKLCKHELIANEVQNETLKADLRLHEDRLAETKDLVIKYELELDSLRLETDSLKNELNAVVSDRKFLQEEVEFQNVEIRELTEDLRVCLPAMLFEKRLEIQGHHYNLTLAEERRAELEIRTKRVSLAIKKIRETWQRRLLMRDKCGHKRWSKLLRFGSNDAEKIILDSGLFDSEFYLNFYEDVALQRLNPVRHYIDFGAKEGRQPNPYFETDIYLDENPDVAISGINPLVHYIMFGIREGRQPNSWWRFF